MLRFSYTKPHFYARSKEAIYFDFQKSIEAKMLICSISMRKYFFDDLSPVSLKQKILLPSSSFTENLVMYKVLELLRKHLNHYYKEAIDNVNSLPLLNSTEKESILDSEVSKFLNLFTNLVIEVKGEKVEVDGIKDSTFVKLLESVAKLKGFKVVNRKKVEVVV